MDMEQLLPPHQQFTLQIILLSSSICDVINGRGKGVQHHPGNANYRTLVSSNKGIYVKCAQTDKAKISKGIVRELGGKFLELDVNDNHCAEDTQYLLYCDCILDTMPSSTVI
ncbi:hypothetical protein ACHAXR_006540 [Thalassiosira sp. AJA248-18]